jgi:hypothetical protein
LTSVVRLAALNVIPAGAKRVCTAAASVSGVVGVGAGKKLLAEVSGSSATGTHTGLSSRSSRPSGSRARPGVMNTLCGGVIVSRVSVTSSPRTVPVPNVSRWIRRCRRRWKICSASRSRWVRSCPKK